MKTFARISAVILLLLWANFTLGIVLSFDQPSLLVVPMMGVAAVCFVGGVGLLLGAAMLERKDATNELLEAISGDINAIRRATPPRHTTPTAPASPPHAPAVPATSTPDSRTSWTDIRPR